MAAVVSGRGPSYANGPQGSEDMPYAWWHLVEGERVR